MLPSVFAAAPNPWLSGNPTIGLRDDLNSTQLPESIATAGNIPCSTTHFVVRPSIPPFQTEKVESACAVMTAYGPVAPGGFAHILNVTARLYNNGGGSVQVYPVPHQKGAVVLESTALGNRLQYYSEGAVSSRCEWNAQTGEWKFYLANQGQWTLKDGAGTPLYVRSDSIAFSNNGRFIVADVEHVAKIRVDLQSGAVVPFATPYIYHLGSSVTPQLAVSDDGNTVVTTSDRGDVTVIDVASCSEAPKAITKPASCRQTTFDSLLRQQITGYFRGYQPRFTNDNQLSLFVSNNISPIKRSLTRLYLVPAGQAISPVSYMALGDSFTSGEGAYNYVPETDTAENKCHVSRQSYPYLIGAQANLSTYSVACSGARIDDISHRAQKHQTSPANSSGSLLPGIKPESGYLRELLPSLITVSIGGNDIGFGDKQKQCLAPGTCLASYEDRQELVDEMDRQLPRLTSLYQQIRQSARSNTKIYAIGYPQVADMAGDCPLNVPLDQDERKLVGQIINYFNTVIAAAAARAGIAYVEVGDSLLGHRLCEPSVAAAMNGIVLGNDLPFRFGPIGNESFHPNQFGHRLLAATLMNRSSGLTGPMPVTADAAAQPDAAKRTALLQAPRLGRAMRITYFSPDMVTSDAIHGKQATLKVEAGGFLLQPGARATVELHSDPQQLADLIVSADGSIDVVLTIPETIPVGWHTVHVLTQDIFGRAVDIYKTLYISDGTPICYAYGNRICDMKEESPTESPGAPPVTETTPMSAKPAPPTAGVTAPPEIKVEAEESSKDDVLAAAASQELHKEVERPTKPTKHRGRVRQFFYNWWHNKTARRITILVVALISIGILVYPRTRYVILNTAGVRSSASVTVIDNETRQPLKNVTVQLNNAQGVTNDDGFVKLDKVRLGDTKLVVTRRAFAPLEKGVTVGWGSNPFGDVLLQPKGLQYSFIVKDFLSGKPIEKAEAVSGDASAFSDKDGKLVLTLDTTSEEPVEITVKAEGYRTDKITETAESTNDKEVKMVPAQQQAFISKRSGKYDLYKIYADGSGESLVLSGTGSEREDITLEPQPNGDNVALVSTRDNQRGSDGNLLSTLNVVNIGDNKVTKLDTGDSIQVVGWVESTVVYIVVNEQPANGVKKQRLMSYNTETSQKLDIASANYFNAAMVAGDKVYYAPAADMQANGATNATMVGFFMTDTSGANTKRLLEQEVWNMVRTGYDTIAFSTGKDWYEYKLGGGQASRSNGAPVDQKTRLYTNNAAGNQSLWIDQRDGKGVLISYDLGSKQEKVLTGQSGLVYPVRWLNNTTAVYRVHSSDETADYAISTNGGEPKKIVNVTNTAGVDKWYYY